MDLLDPSIEFYVLHEKAWKFGGGDIFESQGEKVGSMKRKLISMRADIELRNPDDSIVCIINEKLISSYHIYDVKTPTGEVIGRGKKSMIGFKDSVDMYDSENRIIYRTQDDVMKWNFIIVDAQNKNRVYAEVGKGKKWKDVFAPAFNFKDRYVIHIIDTLAPRIILLAYAIILVNVYHDL